MCFIGVRGMPKRDIESLGVMGLGAGSCWGVLPPPPSPPKSGCLVNYQILRFLTHMRDLDALLVGIDS